jgi:DNA-directed RNA polymerase subunit RPC12/RpoP
MNKVCAECDAPFDPQSREKRRAGGLSIHCPDCSSDDTVRYLGISAGEGKQAAVQVLKFGSKRDREAYKQYWKATSGLNTGKQCQMHFRAKEPAVSFETKATFTGNVNHKGKA